MLDAIIAWVSKLVENAPFAPIAAFTETPLMVIVTYSVVGGYTVQDIPQFAEIVPDSMIDAVPYGIVCDAVRLERPDIAGVTITLPGT